MRKSSFFVNHIQFTTEKLPQFYFSLYIDLLKKSTKNAGKLKKRKNTLNYDSNCFILFPSSGSSKEDITALCDPACCVVTGANHPVIMTVWDRTARRPTLRSALSDARPAWAYGSPQQKQRLCFLHCPLLTYPHHGHIVPHRQGR